MMHYSCYGLNEFTTALGYKGEYIKKYMLDYAQLSSNLTVDLSTGGVEMQGGYRPKWKVDLVDTGMATLTGGRIKRLAPHLGNETFMLTWGDGVSDVNLHDLLAFHKAHGKLATMTAVRPPARFGHLGFDGDKITTFTEKPQTAEAYVKKYGADVVRLWVASQDFRNDIVVSEERINKVGETYRGIRNALRYQLSNLYDYDPAKHTIAEDQLTGLDRWVLGEFDKIEAEVVAAYDKCEFHVVYQKIGRAHV